MREYRRICIDREKFFDYLQQYPENKNRNISTAIDSGMFDSNEQETLPNSHMLYRYVTVEV